MTDTDMLYMSSQAKRITELEQENRELKELLGLAVGTIEKCGCKMPCFTCTGDKSGCKGYKWKLMDVALKLIGGAANENNK